MPSRLTADRTIAEPAVRVGDQAHTSPKAASPGDTIELLFFWAFIAALAWAPFWFGSNTLMAWGINAIIFPGLVVLYEASLLVTSKPHPVSIQRIALPAGLFLVVVAWIVIQNTTWMRAGFLHPIWGMVRDAVERPVSGSITVNRDLTTLGLVRLLTAASAFWLALQLFRNGSRAALFIKAISVIVFLYAVYGLIALAMTPGYVLWYENRYMDGMVTSTFFNRNSYATYGGIGLIAISGMIIRLYRSKSGATGSLRRLKIAAFIEKSGQQGIVLFAAAFIMLVSILLTGSRGGLLSVCLGLFVLSFTLLRHRGKSFPQQWRIILLGAGLVVTVFLAFGDVVAGRITQLGFSDDSRLAIYAITLGSILDAPLLGYGYGTFSDVFPMYRDRSMNVQGVWEMAHNTYLEVFQGLGLVFGSLLLVSVGLLVWYCQRGAVTRHENVTIPCIAVAVAFLVGSNAVVDFSLQIQGITLTFMAILGAGVAQSESSRIATND